LCRRVRGGLVAVACVISAAATARAEPPLYVDDAPHAELFTGFDASDNSVGGYLGAGYAFGKGLYESGWRLRAVGAFGGYDYDGSLSSRGMRVPTNFDGDDANVAALVGYQLRRQSLFLRFFAGIEAEDQHIVPHDPNNSVQGSEVGLKLQAESWFDYSPRTFFSLDASYGTAFQEYWTLARAGYRVSPHLSLGIEGGALGNEEYNAGRGGAFTRIYFRKIEITVSGGFTGNYLEDDPSGYVSLGVYRPF
jgi:cellulose biosynthesis protein BcsS